VNTDAAIFAFSTHRSRYTTQN